MKQQMNGQLMGSIVSFPILCLANAALCSLSIQKDRARRGHTRLPFWKLPMRINGDDCLLLGTGPRFKETWLKYGAAIGLESSIGKTYFSNRIATLNSLCFYREGQKWTDTKVVNLGLLYGYKRSSETLASPGIDALGTLSTELLEPFAPEDKRYVYLHKRFLEIHQRALKSTTLSWFAPRWSGGLGIPGQISETDRKIVSAIKYNFADKVVSMGDAAKWFTHRHILDEFKLDKCPWEGYLTNHSISASRGSLDWENTLHLSNTLYQGVNTFENEYSTIYSKLAVFLYLNGLDWSYGTSCYSNLHHPLGLDRPKAQPQFNIKLCSFLPKDENSRKRPEIQRTAVSRNETLWKKVLHKLGSLNYELIEDHELQNEPKRWFPPVKEADETDFSITAMHRAIPEIVMKFKEIVQDSCEHSQKSRSLGQGAITKDHVDELTDFAWRKTLSKQKTALSLDSLLEEPLWRSEVF